MTEFESFLGTLAQLVGYLSAIYVFVRLIISDWNKKRKDAQQAKIDAEADAHEPIIQKIDDVKTEILMEVDLVKKDVEVINKRQMEDRSLNKLVAQLALSTADETGESGKTNGNTKRAKDALRQELLSRA